MSGIESTLSGLDESTTYFVRLFAENSAGEGVVCYERMCEPLRGSEHGVVSFRTFGPPVAVTFATHAVVGGVLRLLGSVGPEGYVAHYYFEYVGGEQFARSGWGEPEKMPAVELPAGSGGVIVGEDLPVLSGGESYHYRLVVTNGSPGEPVVRGEEQVLRVPVAVVSGGGVCPNEALRTGPSAVLPDCRAYEQVTPVDKEGAQEIFRYEGLKAPAFALVGEDGDNLMLEDLAVKWGTGSGAGQSPYFFSRDPERGWVTTAATVQPEAGLDEYSPQVFSPDLSEVGLEAGWKTVSESPNIEFKAGRPGGPYVTVATVPRKQASGGGWVGASADFLKAYLAGGRSCSGGT